MVVVQGGTPETHKALLSDVNKTTLDAFIDSADLANQMVWGSYSPIWQILQSVYQENVALRTRQAVKICKGHTILKLLTKVGLAGGVRGK